MNKIEHHLPLAVSSRDAQSVVTCHGNHLVQVQYDCAENHNQEFNAEVAAFIVAACNEHAALVAVAEAAKAQLEIMTRAFPNGLPIQMGTLCEEQDWDATVRAAMSALAALAQIRGGEK